MKVALRRSRAPSIEGLRPHLGIPAVSYKHLLHLAPLCSSISVEKCRCYSVSISHREEKDRLVAVARLHALAAGADINLPAIARICTAEIGTME